ncbi:hypothetical protein SB00610_03810 [Klebsiella quasipneumoniae subsp. similipneumoniae]|nr:hypothetical protein SB00610_03810 [Klebsiella quasipneumoniae subsp. similipneumoniae]
MVETATVFGQRRRFTNGVHRQQAQQRGDNRRAHGLNQVEDIGVGIRHHPGRAHDEHHAQGIELAAGDAGFIPFIAEAQDQPVQPLEGAEIVAEERFEDGHQGDNRRAIFQQGGKGGFSARHRGKVIRQIGEHRDILRLGVRHVLRREGKQAAEGEEHHHRHHQHAGPGDNLRTFLFGVLPAKLRFILFAFGDHKRGDDRREVEGEHHNGDAQPYCHQNAVMTG